MEANNLCENLLANIRSSGLNFLISETPYSVNVVIKKTLIKKYPSRYSTMSSRSTNPIRMQHATTESAIAASIQAHPTKPNFQCKDPSSANTVQPFIKSANTANSPVNIPKSDSLNPDPSSALTMQHTIKSAKTDTSPVHILQPAFLNQSPSSTHPMQQHTIKSANTATSLLHNPQSEFLNQDPSSASIKLNTPSKKNQNHSSANMKQKNQMHRTNFQLVGTMNGQKLGF